MNFITNQIKQVLSFVGFKHDLDIKKEEQGLTIGFMCGTSDSASRDIEEQIEEDFKNQNQNGEINTKHY